MKCVLISNGFTFMKTRSYQGYKGMECLQIIINARKFTHGLCLHMRDFLLCPNSLKQHTLRHFHVILGQFEYVIPEPCFLVGLHFWKVIVWSRTIGKSYMDIMKKVQTKVYQCSRHGFTVTKDMLLIQMPATYSN